MSSRIIAVLTMIMFVGPAPSSVAARDLADAVMNGDLRTARILIERDVDVNAPQADGATALHWAAYRDDLEAAELLIRAGADVTTANRYGMTPLLLASLASSAAMVTRLLEAGADPNERLSHGETALMLAARGGRVDVLRALIRRGADVHATEHLRGTSALMWAAAHQQAEALRLLLAQGADVGALTNAVPIGRGPYLAPTARSRIEDARRGVGQAGAPARTADLSDVPPPTAPTPTGSRRIVGDPSPAAGTSTSPVERPSRRGRGGPLALTGGLTPLVFASREGDLESARILVEAGADVNQVTAFGWSPLLTAVHNRYYRLARFLLDHGADPSVANQGGWTPLYLATDNRNIEAGDYPTRRPDLDHLLMIQDLLDHGANPNARMRSSTETRTIFTHQWLYEDGATPFLRAAQSSDLVLMRLLLDHGADPLIPTTNGTTPLMVASGIGWVEGVTYEWSAAHNIDAIHLLLELGGKVNAVDQDGRTALHGAAHKGRDEVVRILVDHGADLAARDYGSRDSIHALAGVTWQAIDYADGLVRIGVQSSIAHPTTAALLRKLMTSAGLPVPPAGRTLDSVCVTAACQ